MTVESAGVTSEPPPPPPPQQIENAPPPTHPRVRTSASDGVVTITILRPRNPFLIGYLPALIFVPCVTALAAALAALLLGFRRGGPFVLALVGCGVAWVAAELPSLLRGLHTRVDLAIGPDELRVTVCYLWSTRTLAYRRGQVIGVRDISTGTNTRGLQVRFGDSEPLEIVAGYPDEQIDAAAAALRRALSDVPPAAPLLRADDPAMLPYAATGRPHEVEIRRLADGAVSVTVPPIYNAGRAIGGVIFALMWLIMLALLLRTTGCWFVWLLIAGGTWAMATTVREYLRREQPLVLLATPTELVIENGPWFASTRRIPRGEIRSIRSEASGGHRRFVLLIAAKRPIELMTDRETDEIERVAAALGEGLGSEAVSGER